MPTGSLFSSRMCVSARLARKVSPDFLRRLTSTTTAAPQPADPVTPFFEMVGMAFSGDPVTIIDDYGHHPVEVKAVLAAAREGARQRVVAVVQPHRYTRLRDLFDEWRTAFNDADTVVLAPVYAAGKRRWRASATKRWRMR